MLPSDRRGRMISCRKQGREQPCAAYGEFCCPVSKVCSTQLHTKRTYGGHDFGVLCSVARFTILDEHKSLIRSYPGCEPLTKARVLQPQSVSSANHASSCKCTFVIQKSGILTYLNHAKLHIYTPRAVTYYPTTGVRCPSLSYLALKNV
jgi:hypothetical protein